jgi:hypothetical protein
MNRKVFSRSSPDICFRDGRVFLFLLRRRAARHPSTRRFAKLFYPPREQSLASFNTTEPICSHTICFDRTTGTCLPRLHLPNITDHSHVDGPASTTNNSPCAWRAIVSARSKGSPRQKNSNTIPLVKALNHHSSGSLTQTNGTSDIATRMRFNFEMIQRVDCRLRNKNTALW